jgi:hypothetical protein
VSDIGLRAAMPTGGERRQGDPAAGVMPGLHGDLGDSGQLVQAHHVPGDQDPGMARDGEVVVDAETGAFRSARAANRPASPPPTITTRREPDASAMAHPVLPLPGSVFGPLDVMVVAPQPAGIALMKVLPASRALPYGGHAQAGAAGRGLLSTTTERGPTVTCSPAPYAAAWAGLAGS